VRRWARLRTLFRDQMVRGPKGLVPTPRAEQLLEQLNQVMAVIEPLIALPAEFVPETSQRTFSLIGSDFVEFILLPLFDGRVGHRGPQPPDIV
jgi:DNA-binding transcriptional LysR family regulator